ncbi:hypothetical protein [Azonexus sp.]|uniref:hypothetical protein n=1 Tax=Azonexus sp. TaxID=1872668 RepID=UPI0027B963FD|nr:hypothetical protein [Azonexus sp.]
MVSKYIFRIRTRNGVIVEHLSLYGRDEADARRKVEQIYNYCEVLACVHQLAPLQSRSASMNYEDVVDLISAA